MSESKGVHAAWVILAVVFFGGLMLWGYLDENQLIYHVKPAHIMSGNWDDHHAKECASRNVKTDRPVLECDGGHSDVQQDVPVRFYGDTRLDLEPDTLRLNWSCEKNGSSRAPITCKAVSAQ